MRILVIGGGGREHALVWKIAQSPLTEKIYCAPGNAGIAQLAECIALRPTDIDELVEFAQTQRIDLTVVGPEAPLIAGIVDRFEAVGLPIFGPSKDPACIEGSKMFAKKLMAAADIPTAQFWTCDTPAVARARVHDYYALKAKMPDSDLRLVIKADGIAAGKGVIIAENETQAYEAVERIMGARVFGASGDHVVIEEYLVGVEASIMVITDGVCIVPLLPSQDHKRAFDNDLGPNTGGMGAYSPVPFLTSALADEAIERIVRPALAAIRSLGIPYRGVLYAGIMATAEGLKCIEFNCRFGDPETQAVLPLLASDIVPLMLGTTDCTLEHVEVRWRSEASVCVVAASGGYPGDYKTGLPIEGLPEAERAENCLVFHAGTRLEAGQTVTDGGRVLSVTGLGANIPNAAQNAYTGLERIHFEGMHYRRDIAKS